MNEVLKEFKIVFGFDDKPLQEGIKKTENSLRTFGKIFGSLVASYLSYNVFKGVIDGYVDFNNELARNVALTGGSIQEVSALGNAMKRFGGDSNSVISAIKAINSGLQQARFGGGALIEVAKKYGLMVKNYGSAEKTILGLANQMGRYDRQTRIAIASQLGLDDAMVRAFADGGKELEKLVNKQKSLGVVTDEDVKISQDFNNSILDLKDLFSAITRDLARVVVPIFTKLVDTLYSFFEYIRKHKVLVIAFFAALAVALSPIVAMFTAMAVESVLAFAPFYAVIAVVSAIALIIEDIYYYFQGWDSATGELVKKYPILGQALERLRPFFQSLFDIFDALVDLVKDPSWDNLANVVKKIGQALLNFVELPFKAIQSAVNSLIEQFPSLGVALKPVKVIIDAIVEAFKWLIDAVGNFSLDKLTQGLNDIKDSVTGFGSDLLDGAKSVASSINPFNWFRDDEPAAQPTPAIAQQSSVVNSSSDVNNYNINQNINQNITSATPKQLADGTNRLLISSINSQRQQKGALQ